MCVSCFLKWANSEPASQVLVDLYGEFYVHLLLRETRLCSFKLIILSDEVGIYV